VGSKVTLAARESSAAIEGQVTSISGSRVRVKTAQGEIEFNVNDAAIVSADGSVPTGGTNKPTETPGSATAATAARPRNVAAWVESKAAVGLQRAVDAGPNRWGALPNRPKGARFQRGLSGDYASGSGGMEEAKKLLSGAPDTQMRTVSRMGENVPPGKTTQEVTAIYSDPMSIRGRSDRIDPTLGRDPDREALIPNLSINDVEAIGFFPNRGDALGWSNNYVRLLQQTNVTPTAGTRGAQFLDELQATLATARYETNDFGRYFANADELNQKLNALFIKYGSRVGE
jgi:hypothetical protein